VKGDGNLHITSLHTEQLEAVLQSGDIMLSLVLNHFLFYIGLT
jgi:hypothetical protein